MFFKTLIGGILLVSLVQCTSLLHDNEPKTTNQPLLHKISSVMDSYYLWYEEINWVDVSEYSDSDPQEYVTALSYNSPGPDKWSFILDKETYIEHYEKGEGVGFGATFSRVSTDYLVFAQVMAESQLGKAGVRRGDTLISLNGKDVKKLVREKIFGKEVGPDEEGYSLSMSIQTTSGVIINKDFSKEKLLIPVIPLATVIEAPMNTIGYLVFNSFMDFSIPHLDTVFEYFADERVSEVIIDLRYNGGGALSVASHIAGYLLPTNYDGATITLSANDKHPEIDTTYTLQAHSNTIDPKKVVIITSGHTASASEFLIMALKEHIDLSIVGQKTAGKPVGMYSFDLETHMFFPISFIGGSGGEDWDFYDGIDVSVTAQDDLLHTLGSEDEEVLAASLALIMGSSTSALFKKTIEHPINQDFNTGFHSIRGFF
ncbi:MAG: S41 family peptidase [Fibrobacterales bacterium]